MPNCFRLSRKNDPTNTPVLLNTVDEELCARFMVGVHPVKYYCDWVNIIGFRFALGRSMREIRKEFIESEYLQELLPALTWFEENFNITSHYETKY